MPRDRVANLSKEVKSFLRRHKMAASRLGRDALKDSRIIGDLLAGKRRVFTTTAQKLLAWMDKWEKGNGDGRSKRQRKAEGLRKQDSGTPARQESDR